MLENSTVIHTYKKPTVYKTLAVSYCTILREGGKFETKSFECHGNKIKMFSEQM